MQFVRRLLPAFRVDARRLTNCIQIFPGQHFPMNEEIVVQNRRDRGKQERLFGRFRACGGADPLFEEFVVDRKSTRLNSSHLGIWYAVLSLKKSRLSRTRSRQAPRCPSAPRWASAAAPG